MEDKNESDDGGTGGGESKTCVDVLLMHKVSKHEEYEKEVYLCTGRGGRVCVVTIKMEEKINCEQAS